MPTEWRIRRFEDDPNVSISFPLTFPETFTAQGYEENLIDVSVIDAVNRFGRKATAWVDDVEGERSNKYPRGTGIVFEVSPAGSSEFIERFRGFVVEQREEERNGRDMLEVETYSFDYFLRKDTIERDFDGETIFDALEEIIEDFTPVKWEPDNVEVVNNEQLTRSYRGEKVDEFLDEVSSKSANEEYGVNDDVEFFFRPREFGVAPRDVDNSQWLDYDFPEESKQTVNEVQLFYGEGGDSGSVIVDRGSDKQELQDNLGLAGPGTLRKEITYEDITNESDARDKAEQVLDQKEVVQRGEVTTFGLFSAEPGDVISVEIVSQDINQNFRIAEIEYNWADDSTTLQLVERTDKDDERLVEITDTLDRVERRNANRDAIATRFVDTETGGLIQAEVQLVFREFGSGRFNPGFGRDSLGFGRSEPGLHIAEVNILNEIASRVTTTLKNAIRTAWRGDGTPDIDVLAIGSDGSNPSRTDTELGDEIDSLSVDPRASGDKSATWEGNISFSTAEEIGELGLKDINEDLFSRLVVDSFELPADTSLDIRYTLTVSNNGSKSGVQTNDGQEAVRDILIANNPDLPTDIAFGSDNTMADESDTALGTELTTTPIDEFRNRQTGVVDVIARLAEEDQEGETIAETGIKSNGTLLTRATFAEFVKEENQAVSNRERNSWENA